MRAVLKEWRRVLKKNGILRLAVQTLRLYSVYQTTKNIEKILGPMYGKWKVGKDEYIYQRPYMTVKV